jgi:L-lactate dehydrogenase complex protein LldF
VLAPLLAQNQEASGRGEIAGLAGFAGLADLPRASSLCGACNDVCPVDIPIPELLLRLRDRAQRTPAGPTAAPPGPSMTTWSRIASAPALWRRALASGRLLRFLPRALRPAPLRAWEKNHVLPPWRGGAFRAWMSTRTSAPR